MEATQQAPSASSESIGRNGESRRKPNLTQQQSSAAQAASSLALLLREDPFLTKLDMHVSAKGDETSFAYAASLLETSDSRSHQQCAEDALGEVGRKLALVESLAERVSRTSPEAVAAPLLRLHGHVIEEEAEEDGNERSTSDSGTSTLVATRERCDRLKRQAEVLEGVATRVESSLGRGLSRMEKATNRLSCVLQLSATLKMTLRLQFEASKLEGFYLDDLRDLTRAAASVAVIEDLLSKPELSKGHKIDIVEAIRPQAEKTAAAVRKAAEALLAEHHTSDSASSTGAVIKLGATLQVYFHLGELPQAAWTAINHALSKAGKATSEFLSPTTLSRLNDTATTEAKLATSGSSKKLSDANVQRALKKKLTELRAEAANKWATEISESAMHAWNLHQVLCRKSDPVSRQLFVDVVSAAPLPEKFHQVNSKEGDFSIFSVFWGYLCQKMGDRLKHVLEYENGKFAKDVSALYPTVRSASIKMLASINDTMQAGLGAVSLEDPTSTSSNGVLGGSAGLDDTFLKWSTMSESHQGRGHGPVSADTWTTSKIMTGDVDRSTNFKTSGITMSMSAVFNSSEWMTLQGSHESSSGLFRLQQAFLETSSQRLCAPLQYMFPDNVTVDEMGNAISHLPLLPSRHDVQKFDINIRQELSLADPREGGGDLSSVSMIAENVINMISQFCEQAKNGISHVGEDGLINASDDTPSEALLHDMKVSKIMSAMAKSLRTAPEKVFLEPYRPAVTSKLEDAASICEQALRPGLLEIEKFVKKNILGPLSRVLNRRIAEAIGRMHYGSYLHSDTSDPDAPSFVQKHLSGLFDRLAILHLSKLPPEYACVVASTVATYALYNFVSNAALIRPLGEAAKLNVTQDLADFELALEQFIVKSGSSEHLSEIGNGKPYAELRAMRNMLFWTGLEDTSRSSTIIAKSLLREVWIKDVRPSTVFHFLFSFAPSLLSSPHHFKKVKAEDYARSLQSLSGEIEEGEASAWMTTMACCDSYKQRESAQATGEGDARIASILISLGPELLRRRRP
ncbi:unnamed protein product [Cylindrotheca closterium]|uniref:Conserved oligomeric Golgi complex subunit 5 helical domain-containing protein n=1 Tax=Cylindrotheca closterium TaxID=2856 RepID=A0AAD2FUC8_9STRA|nr:unnamed protein product [Cylindrotheca closterium]